MNTANRKATDLRRILPNVRNFMTNFLYDEVRACIGLLLRAGLDRDNMTDLNELWNATEGRPIFRATMSLNRFKFFLRCVRFDNYRSPPQRLESDKLAPVNDVWKQFGWDAPTSYPSRQNTVSRCFGLLKSAQDLLLTLSSTLVGSEMPHLTAILVMMWSLNLPDHIILQEEKL